MGLKDKLLGYCCLLRGRRRRVKAEVCSRGEVFQSEENGRKGIKIKGLQSWREKKKKVIRS